VLQADLSKEDDVVQLFDKATYTFGPVQILIINHAISIVKDEYLWEMSLDRWNKTMNANLTSTFLVAREYLKRLKDVSADLKEEACIILIGSTAGKYGQQFHSSSPERKLTHALVGEAGHADYAATKSGEYLCFREYIETSSITSNILAMMYGLTMTLKNEIVKLAPLGRVNCIGPGWVQTVGLPQHF
jgi:NAD(P)-dependent dehydrogenase (short-subunit alcohol dehydrogenase family)